MFGTCYLILGQLLVLASRCDGKALSAGHLDDGFPWRFVLGRLGGHAGEPGSLKQQKLSARSHSWKAKLTGCGGLSWMVTS